MHVLFFLSALISEGCWLQGNIIFYCISWLCHRVLGLFKAPDLCQKDYFVLQHFRCAFFSPLIRTLILFSLIIVWWLIPIKTEQAIHLTITYSEFFVAWNVYDCFSTFLPLACEWCGRDTQCMCLNVRHWSANLDANSLL